VSTTHDYGTGTGIGSGNTHHRLELTIDGMTCASCAARIEKKLNRLPGVHASVNFATEKARVSYTDAVTPNDLVAAVTRVGYSAQVTADRAPSPPAAQNSDDLRSLRERLLGSAVLAVQVIAISMAHVVPGLHVPHNVSRCHCCSQLLWWRGEPGLSIERPGGICAMAGPPWTPCLAGCTDSISMELLCVVRWPRRTDYLGGSRRFRQPHAEPGLF
jgi:copper chaperone CopZ